MASAEGCKEACEEEQRRSSQSGLRGVSLHERCPAPWEPDHCDDPCGLHFIIERERGGGQPLDWRVRTRMGLALGWDFGRVRVHTGWRSHQLCRQLGARAFTVGKDIFFAPDAYDPTTDAGRELIAHELVHVVQQCGGGVSGTRRPLVVRPAGDELEQEAEALARVVAGITEARTRPRVRTALASGIALQRAMVQTVTLHTAIGQGGTWTDPAGVPPHPIATACHFATVYWLFLDEFRRVHTLAEVIKMGNAQLVVRGMLAHGTRKTARLSDR